MTVILTLQPSGKPATIKWLTVGGRTSAYVVELQKLNRKVVETQEENVSFECISSNNVLTYFCFKSGEESELTALSDQNDEETVSDVAKIATKRVSQCILKQ